MKKATFIKKISDDLQLDQRLYKLDPPIKVDSEWIYDEDGNEASNSRHSTYTEYVVVSASALVNPVETYIFESDADGKILNYQELPGSYRDGFNHTTALNNAGYKLMEPENI